ncbi:hypothetical protein MASR2M54_12470 [Aliarcobacter cryaerophilus]
MRKINALVTGIGGGVMRRTDCKSFKNLLQILDLTIIGTDVTDITTGKRLVDIFYRYHTQMLITIKKFLLK